jgi:hypothetical protein
MLTRLLMCVVFLANVVACSSMPPPSPTLLARCELLYGLWSRYEQLPVFHHSGQKARAEWAIYNCRGGNYRPGIDDLGRMLQRGRFPLPPN